MYRLCTHYKLHKLLFVFLMELRKLRDIIYFDTNL